MVEARLSVRDPGCWASALPADSPVQVVVRARAVDGRTARELLEMGGSGPSIIEMVSRLRASPQVAKIRSCMLGRSQVLAWVGVRNCSACRLCESSGGLLGRLALGTDGGLDCTVVAPNRSEMRALLDRLTRAGHSPIVLRAGAPSSGNAITTRQREVVRTAAAMGFFDERRRVGLTDVAGHLGVSKQAVAKLLRKAERRSLKLL